VSLLGDIAASNAAPADAGAAAAAAAATNQGATDGTANGATNTQEPAATRWTVPEDYRALDAVRKFTDEKGTLDPSVLLKSHINLEQQFGRDKIAMPKTDDEWGAVYGKLGRPDAPEGYTYKPPSDLPEGVTVSPDAEKYWRNAAHAQGLSDKQFNGLAKLFLDHQAHSVAGWTEAQNEARGKVETDLKREWGGAYDQNVAAAKVAMKDYMDPDLLKVLDESGYSNDPRMVKVFAKIGLELLGDDKLKGAGVDSDKLTPAQAAAKIEEFRATHHKALFDNTDPEHKQRVRELEALYALKHG
jgi:hypothetical protein